MNDNEEIRREAQDIQEEVDKANGVDLEWLKKWVNNLMELIVWHDCEIL